MSEPIAGLIRAGVLGQPAHPGQLASMDRLVILRPIGKGATSEVLLARNPDSGELCAIKLLRPEFSGDPAMVARFLAAGRAQQRLRHPNMVPVLAVCDRGNGPYLVMPFYPRGSLAEVLGLGHILDSETALTVAAQAAEALQHAHEQGTIHCDIKPENILLAEDGHALLTDLGMARTVVNDPVLDAAAGTREGTAPYMSPAVVAGIKEDTRCDVYSFGALLYHMLTGCPPYDGPDAKTIFDRIRAGPPQPVLSVSPRASAGLVAICQWAMEREQRDRYANMGDVVADLARLRTGRPPVGPRGRDRRVRIWPIAVGPMLTLLALFMAAAVLWLWPRPLRLVPQLRIDLGEEVTSWSDAVLGDWDGDGVPELCSLENNMLRVIAFASTDRRIGSWWENTYRPSLRALTNEQSARFQLKLPHSTDLTLVGMADVTGHPAEEALVLGDDSGQVILSAVGRHSSSTRDFPLGGTFFKDKMTDRRGHTALEGPPRLVQLHGDGHRQLLFPVTTGWGKQPRGLFCFPVEPGPARWTNLIAGIPDGIELIDFDGVGRPDIVLGSYSVWNRNELADGTTDSQCYLYAFDNEGRLNWRIVVGDQYTHCRPLAVRASAEKAGCLHAWLSAIPEARLVLDKSPVGRILRFDPHGRELGSYDAGSCLLTCLAGDLQGDGEDEIFATDAEGFLHVLHPDLRVQLKMQVTTNLLSLKWKPSGAPASDARRSAASTNGLSYVELHLAGLGRFAGARNPCLVMSSWLRKVMYNGAPDNDRTNATVARAYNLEMVILDARLQTVLRHAFAAELDAPPSPKWLRLADLNGDGFTELLVLTKDVTVYSVR